MTPLHFVVPDGIHDPARPSGGNTYDRHVRRELIARGWEVREHAVPGRWPRPDATALAVLGDAVEQIPDGATVLLDGLVASTAPDVLVPQARRLRLVVLVHMPLGLTPTRDARAREHAVLESATAVVTTSSWSRRRLLELYPLAPANVHVAEPGVDEAGLAPGTGDGAHLLCVAAITFGKGHDVLLDALEELGDLPWQCVCVGRLDRDQAFADRLRGRAPAGRVSFPGPRTGDDLDRSYAAADLVVLASRAETYGMVVTEALARGLPVIASDVGGVTEALGQGAGGARPGRLVPPEDSAALAAALRAWLTDPELRAAWRRAARERRETLPRWSATASALATVLAPAR